MDESTWVAISDEKVFEPSKNRCDQESNSRRPVRSIDKALGSSDPFVPLRLSIH